MTKKTGPVFLDLDAVAEERNDVTLKLNGKKHKLQYTSVQTFVSNTKLLQNMGANGDLKEETEVVIKIIRTSFPTLTEEELWDLGLDQLNAIMEFARENNGENKVTGELEEEAGEATDPLTAA